MGCGKACLSFLPWGPLGVRTLTPHLVGGLLCVDQLSQALTLGKGPPWLGLILLTGLKMFCTSLRHPPLLMVGIHPQARGSRGAARSFPCILRKGWPEAGL